MSLQDTTTALSDVVSVALAKQHLNVEHTEDDLYIAALIDAAVELIESEIGGPIAEREYTWTLDEFPGGSGEITLPRHPITSVVSFHYQDAADVQQDLAGYQLVTSDQNAIRTRIRPAYDTTWPDTADGYDKVEIQFKAGYEKIPKRIRQAVLLIVGSLYNNREESTLKKNYQAPIAAMNLLRTFKQYV